MHVIKYVKELIFSKVFFILTSDELSAAKQKSAVEKLKYRAKQLFISRESLLLI